MKPDLPPRAARRLAGRRRRHRGLPAAAPHRLRGRPARPERERGHRLRDGFRPPPARRERTGWPSSAPASPGSRRRGGCSGAESPTSRCSSSRTGQAERAAAARTRSAPSPGAPTTCPRRSTRGATWPRCSARWRSSRAWTRGAARWWASRFSAGLPKSGSSSAAPGTRGSTRATPPAAMTCASSASSRPRWIGWWGRATQPAAAPSPSPARTAAGCRRSMRSTGSRWPSSSTGAASPARGCAGTWSTPAATTTAAGSRRRRRGRAPSTSPRGSSGPGRAPRSS